MLDASQSQSPPPPSFAWQINSATGVFTGEQKAEIVELMESIANLICDGGAKLEFSYGAGAVTTKISPQPSELMRTRARERAAATVTQGFQGFVSSVLLFFSRAGLRARPLLIDGLAKKYLHDDLVVATVKLEAEFIKRLQESGGLGAATTSLAKLVPAEPPHPQSAAQTPSSDPADGPDQPPQA